MPVPPVPKKFATSVKSGSYLSSVRWGDIAHKGAAAVLQVVIALYAVVCGSR
jgi:hypothetical protein